MSRRLRALGLALWCGLAAAAGAQAAGRSQPPLPAPSMWVVKAVEVDQRNQPGWLYHPDDPQLMNRVLEVRADGAVRFLSGLDGWCERPKWQGKAATTLNQQVRRTMSRPPTAGRSTAVTLADLSPQRKDAAMVPHTLRCGAAAPGAKAEPDSFWSDAWIARPDAQRVFIGTGGVALLELRPLTAQDPLTPSFTCGPAVKGVEQQICASPDLAGLDRSMALAVSQLSSWFEEPDRQRLKKSQAAWLATRDACQAKAACLYDAMVERLRKLDAYRTIPLPP